MISLAIPTYNRPEMTLESFAKVLDNPLISEIVIVDDHSEFSNYVKLWNAVQALNSDKIFLLRNATNLKPLRNKYEAVKSCGNEWVILLDSDNIIDNEYVNVLGKIGDLDKNTLYCPEKLINLRGQTIWDYSEFQYGDYSEVQYDINKIAAVRNVNNGNFQTFLNTGNYFLNRNEYLRVHESNDISKELSINDAMYFSYLWLKAGNNMGIIPGLNYIHRVHKGSWYKNNQKECGRATDEIIKLIKQL